ncbi:hypothetical protein [Marinobacterium jannaschii]|uniref:hypothetical protein n=1 Tax=Marinobacterium jannaschii TaxID=64970 RepID=UPI0004893907|nr:hypothetical protein [Marinobacterium jannaschii]
MTRKGLKNELFAEADRYMRMRYGISIIEAGYSRREWLLRYACSKPVNAVEDHAERFGFRPVDDNLY